MTTELNKLRARFGIFLLLLLWAHVPALAGIALLTGHPPLLAALAGAVLAGAYHLAWWRSGIAPATRYLSAVALVGEPALLLYLLSGHPWQMDMHMYFFAMLALTIAWCDRRAIMVAAAAIALHHTLLLYLLPFAVFPNEGDLTRVALHALIVAFQTAVLIWLSDMLVESFDRIGAMSAEILGKNEELSARTREAEDANRAKSLFLANMSHEIRTPMNAILGFCHLVSNTELTSRQQNYVAKINTAGVSLLRLINDILDFSKNEAGKLTLESRPFDMRAAIENQIQLVAVDAEASGVTVQAQIGSAIPSLVLGDELRFDQVLLNLLNNAIKFSDNGTVTIGADLIARNGTHGTFELFVRDTGIGMTAEQTANLFRSFNQADSSTTRRFGGTGLGLAICRQIVEQMGGTIRVESEMGVGSTFIFRVTLAVVDDAAKTAQTSPSPAVRNLRILAADDNPAARQIMQEIFAGWDMPVDLVASGNEVLGALENAVAVNQPYDLVLLDWKMPGMDGLQTVHAMRARPMLEKLPVTLIISAYGADKFMVEADSVAIDAFLTKPLEPRTLLETLAELFPESPALPLPSTSTHAPKADGLRGLRVLLVEDNEINREIATELLTGAGLIVDHAENGLVACKRIAESGADYSGVLMDLQMPEMDGIEATRLLRKNWPAAALPIIAMTAHAYDDERERCLQAGMNDHIAKPVDPAVLVATLEKWLKPRAASPTAPAPSIATPVAELPESLPPFDIAAALHRVNGKTALLRRLIVNFGISYEGVAGELRALIVLGKHAQARLLCHTLKGVAGSLELARIYALTAALETRLGSDAAEDCTALIAELEQEVHAACIAAQRLPLGSPPPARASDSAASALSEEKLRAMVTRRSIGARAAFEDYAGALRMTAEERTRHPVRIALERLDYDEALRILGAEVDAPVHEIAEMP